MTGTRSAAAGTAALAVVAWLIAWAIGVHWFQALLVAAVVATLGAGAGSLIGPQQTGPTWPLTRASRRHGARREVSRLSWMLLDGKGLLTAPAIRRVRTLAAQRLAHAGVDLRDPAQATAAERLLGPRAYSVVIADPTRPVRRSDLDHCLTALEALDPHLRRHQQTPEQPA